MDCPSGLCNSKTDDPEIEGNSIKNNFGYQKVIFLAWYSVSMFP